MGQIDESTLFCYASFSIFGSLRHPEGQNLGRSRSLASLQTMFNLFRVLKLSIWTIQNKYFCHYVPWTKIPDNMKKFFHDKIPIIEIVLLMKKQYQEIFIRTYFQLKYFKSRCWKSKFDLFQNHASILI